MPARLVWQLCARRMAQEQLSGPGAMHGDHYFSCIVQGARDVVACVLRVGRTDTAKRDTFSGRWATSFLLNVQIGQIGLLYFFHGPP